MEEQGEVAQLTLRPRIYMNGFPKSGLHLAVLMARTIEWEPALEPPWAGSFGWNAWSTEWRPLPYIFALLRHLRAGSWLKGHCGYRPEIANWLYWSGAATCFIYRDLRDVLVSQSHHVIDQDDSRFYHPGKEVFREMGHEERLLACLHGVGPFSGLIDRWEQYAPWLHIPWVMQLRYEDMMSDREGIAKRFVQYVYERTTWGVQDATIQEASVDSIAEKVAHNMTITSMSPTYRKGGSGGWREEFTPRVTDEFKRIGQGWLERLGYESGDGW